jgi:hypothetical protein
MRKTPQRNNPLSSTLRLSEALLKQIHDSSAKQKAGNLFKINSLPACYW